MGAGYVSVELAHENSPETVKKEAKEEEEEAKAANNNNNVVDFLSRDGPTVRCIILGRDATIEPMYCRKHVVGDEEAHLDNCRSNYLHTYIGRGLL